MARDSIDVSQVVLVLVVVALVLAIGAGLLARWFVTKGRRAPWVVRRVNRTTERVVEVVKRPITVAVLDEVADVIQTGHYTKNISDAIVENRAALKALVAEKVGEDRSTRLVNRVPGYDRIVDEVSDATLRVIVEMLADPRMDELVSDLLRNNLQQIRRAVRDRQHEDVGRPAPPDPVT
jgi:hypothetical protein